MSSNSYNLVQPNILEDTINTISRTTTFTAPEVSVFNSTRHTERKKRTFKARVICGNGDTISFQPNILAISIFRLNVNGLEVDQFGKIKFPSTFTKLLNSGFEHEP